MFRPSSSLHEAVQLPRETIHKWWFCRLNARIKQILSTFQQQSNFNRCFNYSAKDKEANFISFQILIHVCCSDSKIQFYQSHLKVLRKKYRKNVGYTVGKIIIVRLDPNNSNYYYLIYISTAAFITNAIHAWNLNRSPLFRRASISLLDACPKICS